MAFQKVGHTYIYQTVADKIQQYIVENGLHPGDRLPSHAELCAGLGVGRTSLREGLRLLQTAGVVETRPGLGIFVTSFSLGPHVLEVSHYLLDDPSRSPELIELLEVREALEVHAIARAVDHASDEDIENLRGILEDCECAYKSNIVPLEGWERFHNEILRMSGNETLHDLANTVTHLLFQVQRKWISSPLIGVWAETAHRRHTAIYQALKDRRKQDAIGLLRDHLAQFRKLFLEERPN